MQDRTRIHTSDDYEIRYWSEKFGVSLDQLKAAVNKGNSISAVKKTQGGLVVTAGTQALGCDAGCTHAPSAFRAPSFLRSMLTPQ
jgi:hypothetical protein